MTSIYCASPIYTMVDKSKGSVTNRYECAKEHFKNNIRYIAMTGVPAVAGTIVAIKKPIIFTQAAKYIAKVVSKVANKLGAKTIAEKIMKNPSKFGKVGLLIAGAVFLYNQMAKYIYKAGQIDQKYTDSAKIESQTKNIVLDDVTRPRRKVFPDGRVVYLRPGYVG